MTHAEKRALCALHSVLLVYGIALVACAAEQPQGGSPNSAATVPSVMTAASPAVTTKANTAGMLAPAPVVTPPPTSVPAPGGSATPPLPTTAGAAAPAPAQTPPRAAAAAGGTATMGSASAAGSGSAPARLPASLYDPSSGELRAPAPSDGVQISTPTFDLQPGEERFACYHTEIPIDGEFYVHYYESKMALGSHHFILYKHDRDAAALGTMDPTGCLTGFQSWIYSSAQPLMDLRMPDNVAMVLGSRQRVLFDMHYINTTSKVLNAHVTLNVVLAKGEFEKAASLISYNTAIRLPPHGTQTVGGDCTPGPGAKFFYMLTHTHRRGLLATITRVHADGSLGEELVRSTDWEVPMERKWLDEPLLTFEPGEKFHYSCEYQNDLEQVVTSGPSAATNEMCMAITYYYPASAGGGCR